MAQPSQRSASARGPRRHSRSCRWFVPDGRPSRRRGCARSSPFPVPRCCCSTCRGSRDPAKVPCGRERLKEAAFQYRTIVRDTVGEVGRAGARGYTAAGPPRRPVMSLKATPLASVPERTARVARAALRQGTPLLKLRDELGTVFADADFADLFPRLGQPGLPPWRLALVTLLQFREDLPDRRAAEAVRARIDWKYLLGLEL